MRIWHKLGRLLLYSVIVFIIINIIAFNGVLLYGYGIISDLINNFKGDTWWENYPQLKSLILKAKEGGLVNLKGQTLERLFIVSHAIPPHQQTSNNQQLQAAHFLGVDVSNSGEATYIYKRIISRATFPYEKLVIDIGANDGLLSSNSFNFIQWGYSAVLVEPNRKQLDLARLNTASYVDPYRDGVQTVRYVEAVVALTDGLVDLVLTPDTVSQESYVRGSKILNTLTNTIKVKSMKVDTFLKTYNIPNKFAVLSIDAEGLGDQILHQFMELKVYPAYIIYESLHNKESISTTISYMSSHGYKQLARLGWNDIFEHVHKEKDN